MIRDDVALGRSGVQGWIRDATTQSKGTQMSITSTGDSAVERRLRGRGRAVGYTVDEVAEMLRISRNAAYDLIARGEIASVKVGRLLRVPARPFHDKFGETLPD